MGLERADGEKCCLNRVPVVGGLWEILATDESASTHYR